MPAPNRPLSEQRPKRHPNTGVVLRRISDVDLVDSLKACAIVGLARIYRGSVPAGKKKAIGRLAAVADEMYGAPDGENASLCALFLDVLDGLDSEGAQASFVLIFDLQDGEPAYAKERGTHFEFPSGHSSERIKYHAAHAGRAAFKAHIGSIIHEDEARAGRWNGTGRVLLVQAGGTISRFDRSPVTGFFMSAMDRIADWTVSDADVSSSFWKDESVDVRAADWVALAGHIRSKVEGDPTICGVVVTAGADTLAYTASALTYLLCDGPEVPIVFTCATRSVQTPWSDAFVNLMRAMVVASDSGVGPEHLICIDRDVLRGCRAVKVSDGFHSHASPVEGLVGWFEDDHFVRVPSARSRPQPLSGGVEGDRRRNIDDMREGVFVCHVTPGFDPRVVADGIRAAERRRDALPHPGVVVVSPGLGTLSEKGFGVLSNLVRPLIDMDVPVVVAAATPTRHSVPSSVALQRILNAGAALTVEMVIPAIVAKLSWAAAQVGDVSQGERCAATYELLARGGFCDGAESLRRPEGLATP